MLNIPDRIHLVLAWKLKHPETVLDLLCAECSILDQPREHIDFSSPGRNGGALSESCLGPSLFIVILADFDHSVGRNVVNVKVREVVLVHLSSENDEATHHFVVEH